MKIAVQCIWAAWVVILAFVTNGLVNNARLRDARLAQIEFRLDRIDERLGAKP